MKKLLLSFVLISSFITKSEACLCFPYSFKIQKIEKKGNSIKIKIKIIPLPFNPYIA